MNGSRKGAVGVAGEIFNLNLGAVHIGAVHMHTRNGILATSRRLRGNGHGKCQLVTSLHVLGAIAYRSHRHVGGLGADSEIGGQGVPRSTIPAERRNVPGCLCGSHNFRHVRVAANVAPTRCVYCIHVTITRSTKTGNDAIAVRLDEKNHITRLVPRGVIVDGHRSGNLGERDVGRIARIMPGKVCNVCVFNRRSDGCFVPAARSRSFRDRDRLAGFLVTGGSGDRHGTGSNGGHNAVLLDRGDGAV